MITTAHPFTSAAAPRVVVIACGKLKLERRAPAAELYVGPLFRARRRFAERGGHPWLILSWLHGLIQPDKELSPYDYAPANGPRCWEAYNELEKLRPDRGTVFEFHTSPEYFRPFAYAIGTANGANYGWRLETIRAMSLCAVHASPVGGIGQQLAAYNRMTRETSQLALVGMS